MRRSSPVTMALAAGVMLASALAAAQFRGRWAPEQNSPPATELVVARWRYGTNGWFNHLGWSHNYPSSDQNLNEFIRNATGIDVELLSYRIVDLGSDEVFDYPFAYVSEPGEMALTETEVRNLREFVRRGGFILMDDFDGLAQLDNMRANVLRALPEAHFEAIPSEHPVYRMQLELENLSRLSDYVPGGRIVYYGIYDDDGRLMIAAGHNNDLANFWDWYDEARMPLGPAADAFRLGVNFAVWAMTH